MLKHEFLQLTQTRERAIFRQSSQLVARQIQSAYVSVAVSARGAVVGEADVADVGKLIAGNVEDLQITEAAEHVRWQSLQIAVDDLEDLELAHPGEGVTGELQALRYTPLDVESLHGEALQLDERLKSSLGYAQQFATLNGQLVQATQPVPALARYRALEMMDTTATEPQLQRAVERGKERGHGRGIESAQRADSRARVVAVGGPVARATGSQHREHQQERARAQTAPEPPAARRVRPRRPGHRVVIQDVPLVDKWSPTLQEATARVCVEREPASLPRAALYHVNKSRSMALFSPLSGSHCIVAVFVFNFTHALALNFHFNSKSARERCFRTTFNRSFYNCESALNFFSFLRAHTMTVYA